MKIALFILIGVITIMEITGVSLAISCAREYME